MVDFEIIKLILMRYPEAYNCDQNYLFWYWKYNEKMAFRAKDEHGDYSVSNDGEYSVSNGDNGDNGYHFKAGQWEVAKRSIIQDRVFWSQRCDCCKTGFNEDHHIWWRYEDYMTTLLLLKIYLLRIWCRWYDDFMTMMIIR